MRLTQIINRIENNFTDNQEINEIWIKNYLNSWFQTQLTFYELNRFIKKINSNKNEKKFKSSKTYQWWYLKQTLVLGQCLANSFKWLAFRSNTNNLNIFNLTIDLKFSIEPHSWTDFELKTLNFSKLLNWQNIEQLPSY
jgi:hypothetical protein